MTNRSAGPLISCIIPTFNSGEYLSSCLKSITTQTYNNYEIIVVDQSSTDNTVAIAKSFNAKIIKQPPPLFYSPPSLSRNIGAAASRGDVLYHLDSDMELSAGLLSEIYSLLLTSEYGALIVHELDRAEGFWSNCKALERRCYWGAQGIETARVVKKDVFNLSGEYDVNIRSGEDFDIQRRYGKYCRIGYCTRIVYHNLGQLNLKRLLTKKYNYGKTAEIYFRKSQDSGLKILRAEIGCYFKNFSLILAKPILGLGMITLKTLEFLFGALGLIHNKLSKIWS